MNSHHRKPKAAAKPFVQVFLVLLTHLLFTDTDFAVADSYTSQVTVPENGVYIISIACDPQGSSSASVMLQVNERDSTLSAYGHDNVMASLSVAIPLTAKERIRGKIIGSVDTSNVYLSVSFVSGSTDSFVTVKSDGSVSQSYGHNYVRWNEILSSNGHWESYQPEGQRFYFKIKKAGIYWVMVRPDPPRQSVSFEIGRKLFKAFSDYGVPTSASGAFYLREEQMLDIKIVGTSSMEGATIMSFVCLDGNTPETVGSPPYYIAYTALVDRANHFGTDEKVFFNGKKEINRGELYNEDRRIFRVNVTGTYMVSLRGHPRDGGSLKLVLYQNVNLIFSSFAQRGVSSGQDGAFHFNKDDELYVLARQGPVGENTMISIALLQKT